MISIDGPTKVISLSVLTTFSTADIYRAVVDWAYLSDNMQFLIPMLGSGKVQMGEDEYSDLIYSMANDWKLRFMGYEDGTVIRITDYSFSNGDVSVIAGDCSVITSFKLSSNGTITRVASETVNVWHEPPTVEEIAAGIGDIEVSGMTVEQDALLREAVAAASQAELNTY